MKRVHRLSIKLAEYNPRYIDKHARKKLKGNLDSSGLIETLIWNERTGHLVGGHQRLAIMDELEGHTDYLLDVAAVDLDLAEEKEQNVFLNNGSAMGTWDLEGLAAVLEDKDVDRESLGFDPLDLQLMFDDPKYSPLFDDAKDKAVKDVETLESLRQGRKEYKEKAQKEDDPEFYLVLVFDSREESDRFAKLAGLPVDQRYIDGRRMATAMNLEL